MRKEGNYGEQNNASKSITEKQFLFDGSGLLVSVKMPFLRRRSIQM
jgi:hypothetical protein